MEDQDAVVTDMQDSLDEWQERRETLEQERLPRREVQDAALLVEWSGLDAAFQRMYEVFRMSKETAKATWTNSKETCTNS